MKKTQIKGLAWKIERFGMKIEEKRGKDKLEIGFYVHRPSTEGPSRRF
jgi:hypothetical protein